MNVIFPLFSLSSTETPDCPPWYISASIISNVNISLVLLISIFHEVSLFKLLFDIMNVLSLNIISDVKLSVSL